MNWQLWLAVGLGSAAGGLLRFGVASWLQGRTPWGIHVGTWLVNALGSLVFCWLMTRQQRAPADLRLYLGLTTGVLGGFTTYSTFNGELIRHLTEGRLAEAWLYLGVTVVGCVCGGFAGVWLGRG
jgi:CrcB protein